MTVQVNPFGSILIFLDIRDDTDLIFKARTRASQSGQDVETYLRNLLSETLAEILNERN